MNIFYLDENIELCAQYHNDKHVVKMTLEYAQLMSTAHNILDGENSNLYKTTHIHHPCSIWVRYAKQNYEYLYKLWIAVLNEYTYRYSKVHKSSRLIPFLQYPPKNIRDIAFTQPPIAMSNIYKIENDALASYRNYYLNGKSHLAQWKNREVPEFYKQKIF
ncbi:MAG: pyrimidine dimer DNA glycosylase/endonuclease V [Phycisphaerales bacterium]|nr:pyrimidine dimer DNA glycosylase/endonuclease V [Phycisphaerales bacterium]